MIKKAKEIAQGYGNLLKSALGVSKEKDLEVFAARRKICNSCEHRSNMNRCLVCGCPLAAKTKSLISNCPKGLW